MRQLVGLFIWLFFLSPCLVLARDLTVGVFDNPPIIIKQANGRYTGIAVDVLDAIARQQGWTLQYREQPWDDLLQELDEGKIDILVGAAYTPERAKQYRFSTQTVVTNWAVVYRNPKADINSLFDLRNKSVALMKGSIHTKVFGEMTQGFGITTRTVSASSYAQVLREVEAGRADAGVVNRIFSAAHAAEYKVVPTTIIFNPVDIRYAAPKSGDVAILDQIDSSLAAMKRDSNSAYFVSLRHWLEGRARPQLPHWWMYAVWGAVALGLLVVAIIVFLRHRIRRATHALSLKTQALAQEVEEHKLTASALKASEQRWQFAVESSGDGLWDWNPIQNTVFYSPQWLTMLSLDDKENNATIELWESRLHPDDRVQVWETIDRLLAGDTAQFSSEHRLLAADGQYRWVLARGRVVQRAADGRAERVIGTLSDIGERKAAQAQIEYLATRDPVTDLPNRILLSDRLQQAIAEAQRAASQIALLFLDLDHFKYINDSLGHHVGDALLRQVAVRIEARMRKGDTVARVGGDEFIVMLKNMRTVTDVSALASQVLRTVSEPYVVEEHRLNTSCSIGISLFPDDAKDAQTLLRNADIAMYHAKDKSRNSFEFFSTEMNSRVVERLNLETALRHALERGELRLHYQPVVRLDDGRIVGAEALLRWQHPQRGLLMPDAFLYVAEQTGLIHGIGEWVLRTACIQAKRWEQELGAALQMAVNLSVSQVREPLTAQLAGLLRDTGVAPHNLMLEITEGLFLENVRAKTEILNAVGYLGVGIAIDDFGVGYSSLSYLQRLPIDTLKIDRSFVRYLERNEDDVAIVRAILAMTQNLTLRVIAEGVETEGQRTILRELGCLECQGYLFSRPVDVDAFAALIRQQQINPVSQYQQSRWDGA